MKNIKLTEGPIMKNMLLFALPMMAGNFLQQIYNIADMFIVGRFIGSDALAAVGSAYTLMTFLTSLIIGLCMGSGAIFSKWYGAGQEEEMKQDIKLSFLFISGVTVVVTLLVFPGTDSILHLLSVPDDIYLLMRGYVESFFGRVGGAPCNVAAAVAKLGGNSMMITQLGIDAFGDKIINEIRKAGVDTSAVLRSDKANTSLAFVALKEDGNRDFSFYRKPGADMLFEAENLKEEWFDNGGIFHFCSVALVPSHMRDAHIKALEFAEKHDVFISFDPNLRFMLWEDRQLLHDTVLEFMK